MAVDLPDSDLETTVKLVEETGRSAIAVPADVTVDPDVAGYVQAAVDAFGGVDVLFNNAGLEGVIAPLTTYPATPRPIGGSGAPVVQFESGGGSNNASSAASGAWKMRSHSSKSARPIG